MGARLRQLTFSLGMALVVLGSGSFGCLSGCSKRAEKSAAKEQPDTQLQVGYLEFVTPEVDQFCSVYEGVHKLRFGAVVPELGNARLATLGSGGHIGVRAPLRADEAPTVRAYLRVVDIEAAVASAEKAGAEIAFPPTSLANYGTFAIVIHNGIESAMMQSAP